MPIRTRAALGPASAERAGTGAMAADRAEQASLEPTSSTGARGLRHREPA
jgi:hypothetical protein